MIQRDDLRKIARARLKDAGGLYQNRRYDGAVYLCEYAVEAMLKARICRTLKWEGFPSTRSEFQSYQSFRTHDLDVLLTLSGIEAKIKTQYPDEWSIVNKWSPEIRYRPIGTTKPGDTFDMIEAATVLVKAV
jgi:HEPN domain-containing protein